MCVCVLPGGHDCLSELNNIPILAEAIRVMSLSEEPDLDMDSVRALRDVRKV